MVKKKAKDKTTASGGIKILAENRKARFNYHILETFEAGMALQGWEIKSIREGHINLAESYIRADKNELYLVGAHIMPYAYAKDRELEPVRKRKLLMHRYEIDKLNSKVKLRGFTMVALKIYLKGGRAKLEIAVAKGKNAPDKRQAVRERDVKRDMARALRPKPRRSR